MNTLSDYNLKTIRELLQRIGLKLEVVGSQEKIPGSFWGEPEAGLIKNTLYARGDTPMHSILHEAGHYICMTGERRMGLHTNALGKTKGDFTEENAVCFLQIILADEIDGLGRQQIFSDMDDWGYSFRLGSAQQWYEQDSSDAKKWLFKHRLIDGNNTYRFSLRP